ncbi:MAG: methionyl-tRNA formyltransferase [Anaerolineae bacterium]|nr:methionyl-tRNA formyltransferase [Anaerolineae bacterium]
MEPTRIVFLGTPDFATPGLQTLADHPAFDVVGVVTQPDRPAGRGQQIQMSAVKKLALDLDLPVFQPKTLRDEAAVEHLRAWQPDLLVVAAFGQILRQPVLDLPPRGCVNVHASLLPRWRGAAPIQHAIRAGDEQTGVTIMLMDAGLDTGPLLTSKAIPIEPRETGATLHDKLAALGAEILPDTLTSYLSGDIVPVPQPEEGVTIARSIQKEAGLIDWSVPAVEIDRHVRAYDPWPGTYTFLDGQRVKILGGFPHPAEASAADPGTLIAHADGLAVQTGDGLFALEMIQPEGKKRMPVDAFLAGHADVIGRQFGPG